jgi:hypothetical protein
MRIRSIWEKLLEQEIAHLHKAARMLERLENKHYSAVVGNGDFPSPLRLKSNIDYVRGVLSSSVQNTSLREGYTDVSNLPADADFFAYQAAVNRNVDAVPSHMLIDRYISVNSQDYRFEIAPNPIEALRDRRRDNTTVGRQPASVPVGAR